ncbi:MFS transporter [Goodfellowiella coeruleoviolacea]|uniref:Major Facilitator Superfamily protein n=1 Tax=Goodfellowiella coeruleoviolacea TaxID=334858 RepID=A0AAE3GHZ0_9PSEU|nr:MFS transporter [Goodfellowiella coeruleoviolacea]MCP2168505.1 Major Facilitator Superfamily protein [Goodfellowiella coeruleoviolacea]
MREDAVLAVPVHRGRWIALGTLLAAEAMNVLDATVVQVAAPVVAADLGGAPADIQWFSAAYTLPFALLLITGGRLGDVFGRRRVFVVGVVGFALASLVCALVGGTGALIAARAVQGGAAALVIPQTFGLIKAMFTGPALARALGWNGPVVGLASVCGPVLGAVLTHADLFGLSWRVVFLVNLPLAAAVLATAHLLREDRSATPPRLDLPGTALAVLGTGLVVHPLIQGDSVRFSIGGAAELVAGIAVLVGFGLHQRNRARLGRSPLVEPSLFGDRGFPAALVTSTLFFAVMNGLMLVVVLHVQLGLGAGVLTSGLTLLPWSGGLAVASWLAGTHLVPRHGSRVLFAGLAALLAGTLAAIAVYHRADPHAYPWPLLGALAVGGAGLGLFTVPFFITALSRVRPAETGSAAGLLNAVQQLGATLGVALLGTTFLHGVAGDPAAEANPGPAALTAAQHACWLAVGLLVATTAAAIAMTRPARATRAPHVSSA